MGKKGPVILIGFSILLLIFMAWVSTLPDIIALENQVVFSSESNTGNKVQSALSSAENWKTRLFLNPDSKVRFMPLKDGFKWFSDEEGDGALALSQKENDTISYQLITDNGQFRNRGVYFFDSSNGETTLTWRDTLDVSTSFFARLSAKEEKFKVRISDKNQRDLEQVIKDVLTATVKP